MDAPIRDPKIFNYTVSLLAQGSDPTGHLSELYQYESSLDDLYLKAVDLTQEKSKSLFGRLFSKSKTPEVQKLEKQLAEMVQQLTMAPVMLNTSPPQELSGRQIVMIFEELHRLQEKVKLVASIVSGDESQKAGMIEKFHHLKPLTVKVGMESKYEEGDEFEIPMSLFEFNTAHVEGGLLEEVYNFVVGQINIYSQVAAYSPSAPYSQKDLIAFRSLLKQTISNSQTLNEYQKTSIRNFDSKINHETDKLKKECIEPETIEKFGKFATEAAKQATQEAEGSKIYDYFKDDLDRTIRNLVQAYTVIETDEEELFKPTEEEKSPSPAPDARSV